MDDMEFDPAEQTQVLDLDEYLEDTDEEEDQNNISRKPVGYLKVSKIQGFPETTFPVYEGDNLIGRDDRCNITIPTKPLSKKHACIEVRDGTHLLYDCNSRNRSRRNKVFLKPQVRYELQNEDMLIFADVNCQYFVGECKEEVDDKQSETGSETGSESMLPESVENLESGKDDQKLTSSPIKAEVGELNDSPIMQPTKDHRSKKLGSVSPVFCAETDEETEEETDEETDGENNNEKPDKDPGKTSLSCSRENEGHKKVDSSFADDQTLLYSPAKASDNNRSCTEATLEATVAVVPDTIPATPGIFDLDQEDDTPVPLKRAVDVRCDPFKRRSTGNTLDYGLGTLENQNLSRESADISGEKSTNEKLPDESSPVKCSANNGTSDLDVEQDKDSELVSGNSTTVSHKTAPEEDADLYDLMATQAYEPHEIPESPDSGGERPLDEHDSPNDKIEIPGDNDLEATQLYKMTHGDSPGGQTANESVEDTAEEMPTQAYGLSDDGHEFSELETGDEMATQAYGIDHDELATNDNTDDDVATQAYGRIDEEEERADKEPGGNSKEPIGERAGEDAEATQLFLENDENQVDVSLASSEVNLISPAVKVNISKKSNASKFRRSRVTFADTSDSENASSSHTDVKRDPKVGESSDSSDLPSLGDYGIAMATDEPATDSAEEFLPTAGRRSSRVRTPSKRYTITETVSPSTRKSPSVVIEGENALSGQKRCYVECTLDDKTSRTNKIAKTNQESHELESPRPGKGRGRGRKSGTRKQAPTSKPGAKQRASIEMDEETLVGYEEKKVGKGKNDKNKKKEEKMVSSKNNKTKANKDKESDSDNKQNELDNESEVLEPAEGEVSGKNIEIKADTDEEQDTKSTTTRRNQSSAQRGKRSRKRNLGEGKSEESEETAGNTKVTRTKSPLKDKLGNKEKDPTHEDDGEKNSEAEEQLDQGSDTKRTRKSNKKEESKEKASDEDIFKLDDAKPASKRGSVSKQQPSRTSSVSKSANKTGTESSSRGRQKGKQTKETPKQDKDELFLTPEPTVSSSQRSRRSSTSSETSSQGSAQKRRRGSKSDKSEQGNQASPVSSKNTIGTPSKRTKLDNEAVSNVKVMFTGLPQEVQARKIVEDLHGEVVESVYECTHLVTDKVRRTVKFLCAVSRGIPVVDKRWLQACKKSKSFIDCSNFTVKDKASEKQYEFSLDRSLQVAEGQGLLEGYQVHVTPNVVPKSEFMKDIIQCAKGKFLPTMPTSFSGHVLVVSCEEDKNLSKKALSSGCVHSSELLLTGVLRQQLDLKQFQISQQGSSTPSKRSSRRR